MKWLSDIEVVLFDLDGTLYQDHTFYRPYLSYLLEGTAYEEQISFWHSEADRILSGEHPIRIGDLYSKEEKLGLRHERGRIVQAINWQGDVCESRIAHAAGLGMDKVQYVGDAWSVVGIIAAHLDIAAERRQEAFLRVRADMAASEQTFAEHADLSEAVRSLKGLRHKLLMTNSQEEAAASFVARLGLEEAFDQIVYGGEKPDGINRYLEQALRDGFRPEAILTIGDHAWNDLYPVKGIGGRTVWVSPYDSAEPDHWDLRLRTTAELAAFLRKLQELTEGQLHFPKKGAV